MIPARWASSRFPGKALADILGKPMIVRTWEQACKASSLHHVRALPSWTGQICAVMAWPCGTQGLRVGASAVAADQQPGTQREPGGSLQVVVATDDSRIADVCTAAGAEVVMTPACPNGALHARHLCAHALHDPAQPWNLLCCVRATGPDQLGASPAPGHLGATAGAGVWSRAPTFGWPCWRRVLRASTASLGRAGTVRCSEAVDRLGTEYDVVVNIQGDEPLMEPSVIDEVVHALLEAPSISYR